MKTITKTQFDALSDADKTKYQVNLANAEEYVLLETLNDEKKEAAAAGVQINVGGADVQKQIDEALAKQKKEIEGSSRRKAAEEQGNYKELYEAIKPEYDALKAETLPKLQKEIEDLTANVNQNLQARIDVLPDAIKNLNPKFKSIGEQTTWVETAEKQAVELKDMPAFQANRSNPEPHKNLSEAEKDALAVRAVASNGSYARM